MRISDVLYFYGGTPMTNTTYVAYSDEVEKQRPDEDELINSIVEALRRSNELAYKKYKHGVRDQHAKSHGVLRGELTVYPDLDPSPPPGLVRDAGDLPRHRPDLQCRQGRSGATKYTFCVAWRSRCSACMDRRCCPRTTA